MYDGKKNTSYEIFYAALETVKNKMQNEEKSALEIWKKALDNVTPQVEVKSRRVGGATFQVPTEIRADRKESISMKNLIIFARKRGGKSMADKLAAEIMDAFNEQGGAYKRKEDMHRKMCIRDSIQLVVPVAHIWYFRSLPNKICYLLGLPTKKLDAISYYERYVAVSYTHLDVYKRQC